MAVLDFSATLPLGPGYESVTLIGSRGAAYADDHHNSHLLYRGEGPTAVISGQGSHDVLLELQAFVDSIGQRGRPPDGCGDCLRAHRVIDGAARSLESGRVLHERGGCYESL